MGHYLNKVLGLHRFISAWMVVSKSHCRVPNYKPKDEIRVKQESIGIVWQKLLVMFHFDEMGRWEDKEADMYQQHACTICDMK
jgi:hypothetical protein